MPARESNIQSQGVLDRYILADGREVYVSNGLPIEEGTQRTLVQTSDETVDYLLKNAILSPRQKEWLEERGRTVYPGAGYTPFSKNEIARMKR